MRTDINSRPRFASQLVAGLAAIKAGIFGRGTPVSADQLVSMDVTEGTNRVYTYYQGDLFLPGTGNWVMDPSHETPLATNYGHGFNYPVGVFAPLSHPQVYIPPANLEAGLPQNRVRGIQAGQMMMTPLLVKNPATPAPTPSG